MGPFISNVRKAHPAIRNRLIIRVFTGTASLEHRIRTNAIPIAPLNPPYVNATTYTHFSPYPELLSLGIKIAIEKNLANNMHRYNIPSDTISSNPIKLTN